MSDQDRGAYAPPTDAPLSFDARQPVRGSRPMPLALIASGLVLVLLVAAIVVFYRSGVREAGQAPRTVGAPVGEIAAAPSADAQPQDPAAGLQIYKSEDGSEAAAPPAPTFTAPPEQPQARPAPRPLPPPPPPVAAPTSPVAAQPVLRPAQPAPAPKAAAALPPAPKAAPVAPAAKTAAAQPPAPKTTPAAQPGSGGFAVQIGAFSSQAQVESGWSDAARISPAGITGKSRRVEPIERGGQTLYRTAVTGFATRADAAAFCNQLKAAGKNCFIK